MGDDKIMSQGINRAYNRLRKFASSSKPCIFLSHRSLDKDFVEKIGEYINKAGIDIYLDKYDSDLQRADKEGNDKATTKCIQDGLEESTHVMCALSLSTYTSWWVPYEIGYGDNMDKKIFSLKLKDLPESKIPSFLKINPCLIGIKQLNEYLRNITNTHGIEIKKFGKYDNASYDYEKKASIIEESYSYHPLSKYLDQ